MLLSHTEEEWNSAYTDAYVILVDFPRKLEKLQEIYSKPAYYAGYYVKRIHGNLNANESASSARLMLHDTWSQPSNFTHTPSGGRASQWDQIVSRLRLAPTQTEQPSQGSEPFWKIVQAESEPELHDALGSRIDVEYSIVQEMLHAQVLLVVSSNHVVLNHSAVVWASRVGFNRGTLSLTSHCDVNRSGNLDKLSVLALLHNKGWKPATLALTCHSCESETLYENTLSKSKLYFLALLQSDRIFDMFPVDDERHPFMLHGMPEKYYKAMLTLKGPEEFRKLMELIDATNTPQAIVNSPEFAALVDAASDDESDEEDVNAQGIVVAPHLLALPAPPHEEVLRARRMAAAVLTNNFSARDVNLAETRTVSVGGKDASIHLDGFSHASGRQRIYCACPNKKHPACFKYMYLDSFASEEVAFAWMALWWQWGLKNPDDNKSNHLKHKPLDSDVAIQIGAPVV